MNNDNVSARLTQFEGSVPYMYKCTGGDVTVGVGHAVQSAADAAALSWAVAADQVLTDFAAVAAAPKGSVAASYQHLSQCRMSAADIGALLASAQAQGQV